MRNLNQIYQKEFHKFNFKYCKPNLKAFAYEKIKNPIISQFSRKSYSHISMDDIFSNLNKHSLKSSPIRNLDIGKNYFCYINPKRKKILMTLLNSYLKALEKFEVEEFQNSLDIFYKGTLYGKSIKELEDKQLDLSLNTCWHLNSIFFFERTATSYCRFEYMDYHNIIESFNKIPEQMRNKAKYIVTTHPTQPNSLDQIKISCEMLSSIEENDLDYLDTVMKAYKEIIKSRAFTKPAEFDELETTLKTGIPNMIEALGMAYEIGFKELSNFFELPGVYIQPFKEGEVPFKSTIGLISTSHVTNLEIVVNEYLNVISEANCLEYKDFSKIVELLEIVKNYISSLKSKIESLKKSEISESEFFKSYPSVNLFEIEERIKLELSHLNQITKDKSKEEGILTSSSKNIDSSKSILESLIKKEVKKEIEDTKYLEVAKKLGVLFEIFGIRGATCQVKLPGKMLFDINNLPKELENIFLEIKALNTNGKIVEMVIISYYSSLKQYECVKELIKKYDIKNSKIVPLLETFANTNNTESDTTMIAFSDTRKNDGILLTELRSLRENRNNPDKHIFMGQGITAERGGGPFNLLHLKYKSLVKSQRKQHIRTVQGYYFTSEFNSRDTAFTFLLTGNHNLNQGEHFSPSTDYMDFLFELDSAIGVPQREMKNSNEWNDLFIKNHLVKTLAELYNYAGSHDKSSPISIIKNERAVVQAYINSDRCSYIHPELAYWDKLTSELNQKIIKYYYENNPHFKYILSNYAFMLKRLDINMAIQEVGIDTNNKYFPVYLEGVKALEKILNKLGMGPKSTPIQNMYNQHLGLLKDSKSEEYEQKNTAYKNIFTLQNYQVKKFLKEKKIGTDYTSTEYKIKVLQSALSNISQFNGKG